MIRPDQGRGMDNSVRLSELASLNGAIIWQVDLNQNAASYWGSQKHLFVNNTVADSGNWLESVHPDDRDRVNQAWQISLANSSPIFSTYRLRQSDGTFRWVEDRGVPVLDDAGQTGKWVGTVIDVHDRIHAERELLVSQERLRIAAESASLGLWEIDLVTGYRWISETAANILGHRGPGWVSRDHSYSVIHPLDEDRVSAAVTAHVDSRSQDDFSIDFRIGRTDKVGPIWVTVIGKLVFDPTGAPVSLIGSVKDITQQQRQHDKLLQLAYRDEFTGLPNRQGLLVHLDEYFAVATPASLAMIGLDGFKDAEEWVGTEAADVLLAAFVERVTQLVGTDAFFARFGVDEFAVSCSGSGSEDRLSEAARSIHSALNEPFEAHGRMVFLAVTIGTANTKMEDSTAQDILGRASLALSQARFSAPGGTHAYTEEMFQRRLRAQRLNDELPRAVLHNEFILHYQPQVRISDGEWTGMEALMRWQHPVRGLLAPAHFIEALGQSRWASAVGNAIMDQACAAVSDLRKSGIALKVGVNLFPAQFHDCNLVSIVHSALARHDLPAQSLEIEITENIVLADDERVLSSLKQLRDMGCGIAFDDYGTGYASLSMLKRYPVTRLKIDRSFVANVCASAGDSAIIEAVLGLGRNFDLDVIAEGIETAEQAALLEELGCREAQGYFFGRPMPLEDLNRMCRQSRPSLAASFGWGYPLRMQNGVSA